MTNRTRIIAAWGSVVGAVVAGALAFPIIGQASDIHIAQTVATPRPAQTINLQHSSDLALKMADVTAAEPVFARRDANHINDLVSMRHVDRIALRNVLREKQCLAEAVYYEARSETRSGQKAVAEVVMNRVGSKHFPNSICDVVYQGAERKTGCQFSFTCDGSMDVKPKGKAWRRAQDVAGLVMTGGVEPMTNLATHYHTTAVTPKWSDTMRMTRRVGSHVFYRFAPRNYKPSEPMVLAPPTP